MPKKYPNTSKKAVETPYSENPHIRVTLSIILYTFLIYLYIKKRLEQETLIFLIVF